MPGESMTMMTKTTMRRSIFSTLLVAQGLVFLSLALSFSAFVNAQTAFLSAFLVVMGSMYSYRALVKRSAAQGISMHHDDVIEKIEDPHGLYDDDEESTGEDVSLKEVVAEERARLKASKTTLKDTAKAAPASFSLWRLLPYAVLVLGFIALKNNGLLDLRFYLPALGAGIIAGYRTGAGIFLAGSRA